MVATTNCNVVHIKTWGKGAKSVWKCVILTTYIKPEVKI